VAAEVLGDYFTRFIKDKPTDAPEVEGFWRSFTGFFPGGPSYDDQCRAMGELLKALSRCPDESRRAKYQYFFLTRRVKEGWRSQIADEYHTLVHPNVHKQILDEQPSARPTATPVAEPKVVAEPVGARPVARRAAPAPPEPVDDWPPPRARPKGGRPWLVMLVIVGGLVSAAALAGLAGFVFWPGGGDTRSQIAQGKGPTDRENPAPAATEKGGGDLATSRTLDTPPRRDTAPARDTRRGPDTRKSMDTKKGPDKPPVTDKADVRRGDAGAVRVLVEALRDDVDALVSGLPKFLDRHGKAALREDFAAVRDELTAVAKGLDEAAALEDPGQARRKVDEAVERVFELWERAVQGKAQVHALCRSSTIYLPGDTAVQKEIADFLKVNAMEQARTYSHKPPSGIPPVMHFQQRGQEFLALLLLSLARERGLSGGTAKELGDWLMREYQAWTYGGGVFDRDKGFTALTNRLIDYVVAEEVGFPGASAAGDRTARRDRLAAALRGVRGDLAQALDGQKEKIEAALGDKVLEKLPVPPAPAEAEPEKLPRFGGLAVERLMELMRYDLTQADRELGVERDGETSVKRLHGKITEQMSNNLADFPAERTDEAAREGVRKVCEAVAGHYRLAVEEKKKVYAQEERFPPVPYPGKEKGTKYFLLGLLRRSQEQTRAGDLALQKAAHRFLHEFLKHEGEVKCRLRGDEFFRLGDVFETFSLQRFNNRADIPNKRTAADPDGPLERLQQRVVDYLLLQALASDRDDESASRHRLKDFLTESRTDVLALEPPERRKGIEDKLKLLFDKSLPK
jgi:hypothetical protein